VALQLLRGLEEILMKGATHNLVVRTRTDVALYVLNHKRGHLRDLESSFKVSLAVIADPTVSGQQSYVIDRGEQVHTLEAAKALLAAQVAAYPTQVEEAFDEDEVFDAESESEVESEETEGLADEGAVGEEGSDAASEGPRRKRRRRRRGRGGEARESGMPREENSFAQDASAPVDAEIADEGESEEDEAGDQPNQEPAGQARSDAGSGERRPRRRGRRGGRRRRGGPEDGLAGSIADELGPLPAPEAASAVADFDGYPSQPSPATQPTPEAPVAEQASMDRVRQPSAAEAADSETQAQEAEKAARRRSTVREKVSFAVNNAQPEQAAPAYSQPRPSPSSDPAQTEPASEAAEGQPRRAGWWSRRFGGSE
jgi:ribonuclease E